MNPVYLVFDIGATNVKYGLLDEQGNVHSFESYPSEGKEGGDLLGRMKTIVKRHQNTISGVAISSAGVIDVDQQMIRRSGAFPSLDGLKIEEWLGEINPNLRVSIENDGNCAVYAEKWLGMGRDLDHFITISLGTAVGGGLFLNGGLVRGDRLLAGEFGSTYINLHGRQQTLNSVTGVRSVRKRYAEAKQVDMETLTGEVIFPAYPTGEEHLDEIIDDFYKGLALFIYNINHIINAPIIISGGVTKAPDFEKYLMNHLENDGDPDQVNVKISSLGAKANLAGALYAYLKRYTL